MLGNAPAELVLLQRMVGYPPPLPDCLKVVLVGQEGRHAGIESVLLVDQGPFIRPGVDVDALLSQEQVKYLVGTSVVCRGLGLGPLGHKRAY